MTRINVVKPECLTDQHLMAEYRELPMVHAALIKSLRTKRVADILKSIPKTYTLNKGHVTFFYDKLLYLRRRYDDLVNELLNRGYQIDLNRVLDEWESGIPDDFFNDWNPSDSDVEVLKERLVTRLHEKLSFYKFLGDSVDSGFYDFVEVY